MDAARLLLDRIDQSPSPYHVVETVSGLLESAGFRRLYEGEAWAVTPGGAYYATRGDKTIIAWREGTAAPEDAGYRVFLAHTDSPTLKVKPNPDRNAADADYLSLDVYGSPLLHTWFDRDLILAGQVHVKDGGFVSARTVRMETPRLRLNSLAPHLKSEKRVEAVNIDLQDGLLAAFGRAEGSAFKGLARALGAAADFAPDDLLSFDLCMADAQPSALVGIDNAFLSAPRLDNLFCCYTGLEALLTSTAAPHGQVLSLFDVEEIGSGAWTGARSDALAHMLERSVAARGGDREAFARAKARSILLSADMAHAEHPSHKSATDAEHAPTLNAGVTIKAGARGNYAIGHGVSAWFSLVCREAGVPVQDFMYRTDHGGGASVGPLATTGVGVVGVDVGAAMLAMHASREMAGADDVAHSINAYAAFFNSPIPLP